MLQKKNRIKSNDNTVVEHYINPSFFKVKQSINLVLLLPLKMVKEGCNGR